jgi:hypothetical protein
MVSLVPFGAVALLAFLGGWYAHMKFGAKAQSVADKITRL